MKGNFRACLATVVWFLGVSQLTGCGPKKAATESEPAKRYSLYVMMDDGAEYLLQTDTIDTGHINPLTQGARITPSLYYELIAHGNYYYWLNWKTGRLMKSAVVNKQFTPVDSVQLTGRWSIDNYTWVGDTLQLIGYDAKQANVRYARILPERMTATERTIDLPAPTGRFNAMSVGFSTRLNGNLYLGYTYNRTELNRYTTSDTLYVAQLTYPDLKPIRTVKDTRSTYPGGVNTRQSHFFTDEIGDFYFIACPGIALGDNPTKPTGIFRITKATGALDTAYFFNLSASPIHNHGYGFWYISNGKAIVRTERKGLFTGMQDHYRVPHFDFYVLDLARQTTARLALPLDKGTARNCVLVQHGRVYITVNSATGGNYVWMYDPSTGSLRKGLHVDGPVDYILRLDELNP